MQEVCWGKPCWRIKGRKSRSEVGRAFRSQGRDLTLVKEEGEGRRCSSEKVTAVEQRPNYWSVCQAPLTMMSPASCIIDGEQWGGFTLKLSISRLWVADHTPPNTHTVGVMGLSCAWIHGYHGFICVEYSRRR